MNTNTIKSFAKKARLLLLDGVAQRLKYWGFAADGSNDQTLEITIGGYIFRSSIFTNTTVPAKWNKLKKRINTPQDIKDVVEEAAYTWFNRLMAVKILEMNGYIQPALNYIDKQRLPTIVQNAKRGVHQLRSANEISVLQDYLRVDQDEQAFGLLITSLCNQNKVLYNVFGHVDDYTEILLPQNLLQTNGLLDLINSDDIANEDYREVELIGWLYQFYISDKKDEVFAGFKQNKKARAEDIPAATQIFTPKWIVQYMVENTIGKIYLDYDKSSSLRSQMKYLVETDTIVSTKPLIDSIESLTLIDPACGSGHILVTGFELLFKMYREEGYTSKQAVENILEKNLFGLDIDERAMQLARFAVLLKAAQFDADILLKGIMPHIYCFEEDKSQTLFSTQIYHKNFSNWDNLLGMKLKEAIQLNWVTKEVNIKTKKEEEKQHSRTFGIGYRLNDASLKLLDEHYEGNLVTDYSYQLEMFWGQNDLSSLDYSTFFYTIELLQQGKNIGSALKISLNDEIIVYLKKQYADWQKREAQALLTFEEQSIWNTLRPLLDLLLLLCQRYMAVVANPPYMGQKSMNDDLKEYVNDHYPLTKADLFATFMEVGLNLCEEKGLMGMINQHSWMFLSSFEAIREHIISHYSILSMLHLGPRTFEELSGEVVQSTAFVLRNAYQQSHSTYHRLVDFRNNVEKEANFLNKTHIYLNISQNNFHKIPGSPIAYWVSEKERDLYKVGNYFDKVCFPKKGIDTGENAKFLRLWFEVNNKTSSLKKYDKNLKWFPYNKGGEYKKWYGNRDYVLNWFNNGEEIKNRLSWKSKKPTIRNTQFHFREGFAWSTVSSGGFSCRYAPEGSLFDNGGCTLFADSNLMYFGAILNSKIAKRYFEFLSPTLNFQPGDVGRMLYYPPTENYEVIEKTVNYLINISKIDWDSRETSWDFECSPLIRSGENLRSAFRLWQATVSQDFFHLHTNEEELNSILIEIYGLENELTPDVSLRDITILQEELDRSLLEQQTTEQQLPFKTDVVVAQFISYAIGLFMGRYRLDRIGLNVAHPNPTEEELASYIHNGYKIEIDEDGVIPIMGNDCAFADDALLRVRFLLQALWGEDTLTDNLNFIQEALSMDLHRWLTEKFWSMHLNMYKKKPIYWLFCSNSQKPEKSAFKVLVYMHRMDKFTIQKIQRSYLHAHQEFIKEEIDSLVANENSLSKTEQRRLEMFRNWEIECRDYNEVLKALAVKQISFDLDDGVDINYGKFAGAVAKI